jgi:hypothetical protein
VALRAVDVPVPAGARADVAVDFADIARVVLLSKLAWTCTASKERREAIFNEVYMISKIQLFAWKVSKDVKNGRTVTQHVLEKNVLKQQSRVKNVRCKERMVAVERREREEWVFMRSTARENMKHDDV